MHDQVWVPADRRREMRVARRCQAEVSQARRVIASLLHRSQHQEGNRLLFRLAAQPLEEPLKVSRARRGPRGAQAEAERRDELLEFRDLERVGGFVNAIQGRNLVTLEVSCHGLVRHEHELFDDPVGDVPLGGNDLLDEPGIVHDDFRLFQIEVNRAATMATAAQEMKELLHQFEERHDILVTGHGVARPVGEDRVHRGIGQACVASNDPVVHLVADDLTLPVDFHEA